MPPLAERIIRVEGFAEYQRAISRSEKVIRDGFRKELREAAEPVRRDAQALAIIEIPRMHKSPQWARMRTGITRNLVYVVPREKGTKRRPNKRPNLAVKLLNEAMSTALDRNIAGVEAHVDRLLTKSVREYGRG